MLENDLKSQAIHLGKYGIPRSKIAFLNLISMLLMQL